jgi:hypothetical protein
VTDTLQTEQGPLDIGGVQYELDDAPSIVACTLRPVPLQYRTQDEVVLAAYLAAAFDMRGWIVVDHMNREEKSRAVKPIYIMITAPAEETLLYLRRLYPFGYINDVRSTWRWRIRNIEDIYNFIVIVLPFVHHRRNLLLATLDVIYAHRAYKRLGAAHATNAEIDAAYKDLMANTFHLHSFKTQTTRKASNGPQPRS